jgi:hypothetical protein
MLTLDQISDGALRLTLGKLNPGDVDSLVSVFQMFLAELEQKYGYKLRKKLEELDDTLDDYQKAAQVAACIIKLEELSYGVASFTGDLSYKEKDEYFQYVIIAFSKIYSIPIEWSQYSLSRWSTGRNSRKSFTIFSDRVQMWK